MITINPRALAAVSHLAATKDIRTYLCGVCVEASERETILIATNGHALLAHSTRAADNGGEFNAPSRYESETSAARRLIIPIEQVKAILRAAKRADFIILHADTQNGVGYASLEANGHKLQFPTIDARFPDWRNIAPKPYQCERAQFKPELLQKFVKARTELGHIHCDFVHVYHNGNMAALADVDADCLAVVMPYRSDDDKGASPALPEWVTGVPALAIAA